MNNQTTADQRRLCDYPTCSDRGAGHPLACNCRSVEQPTTTRTDFDFPKHIGEYHGALNREWASGVRGGTLFGLFIGVPVGAVLLAAIVWGARYVF